MFSQQMALLAGADVLKCSVCAICLAKIIRAPVPSVEKTLYLHSHPEVEISFKFIPKILMGKECIHFFGPLCI